jgi:MFS family permease
MLGMVGVGLILNPILITLLFAPVAFGRGVSEPVLQNLTTRFSSKRSRGKLLGFYQSGRSMGMILGPIWTGYVFEVISPQAVFLVGAGMVLVNTTFAWRLKQREIPSEEKPPEINSQ